MPERPIPVKNEANVSNNSISLMNIVPKGHKLYHLFNFISQNYGESPQDIIRAISTMLEFDKGFRFYKNGNIFSLKNVFNLFRYTLPASLYGIEMVLKIKKYINEINKKELSEYDKRQKKLKEFLRYEPDQSLCYINPRYLNEEILFWLLKSPKTVGYKIIGYYNHSLKPLDNISFESERNEIFVIIEYEEKKILIDITIIKSISLSHTEVHAIIDSSYSSNGKVRKLEALIVKNFILTFNTQENIIEYRNGLDTRKRTKINEEINQYDVTVLERGIRRVLCNKRKRGYAIIGLQGTGKSMITKKLEELLTDITIIRLGPETLLTISTIKRCFQLIRIVQPVLVIIEDLDALGFKEKNERVHTLINEIDDTPNIVIVVTINDTEMVHKTIIDRPGRFDEIIEIKPPQSKNEAYKVMASKFYKLKHSYSEFKDVVFPTQKDLNELLERCLQNKFTQAELTCGIIEKVFINTETPEISTLINGIETAIMFFEASKRSLKTYSFNKQIKAIEEVEAVEEGSSLSNIAEL